MHALIFFGRLASCQLLTHAAASLPRLIRGTSAVHCAIDNIQLGIGSDYCFVGSCSVQTKVRYPFAIYGSDGHESVV